jgi:hypothetical protein
LANATLGKLAYYLVLIGGILMVILSLIDLLGMAIRIPFSSPLPGISLGGLGVIVPLILGIIAIVGAKHVTDLIWAIVLIIIGFVGGGLGGLLVLIGGLLGLLARFV